MFCPQCRAEYRSGFARCSDCDVPLVSSLPREVVSADDADEVVVFVAADFIEAEAVKGLLETSGIEVFLVGENSQLPGIPGAVQLVVRDDQAKIAHELIEEYRADDSDARGYIVPFPSPGNKDGGNEG